MLQQIQTQKLEDLMMAMVGLETTAYMKPVTLGGVTAYAVHAADGTQLALFKTKEEAYGTAVKHNLELVNVH